jgi:hypothetical protein
VTKSGWWKLKKHSLILPVCTILLSLLVAGCSSTSALVTELNPLKFIGDHDLYFHFPVKANEGLAEQFMDRYFVGAPQKTKNQILSRIASIYGGFTSGSNKLELVVLGSFPKVVLKSALTKKNGWTQVNTALYRWVNGLEINIETPGLLLIADDVEAMSTRSLSGEVEAEWLGGSESDSDIQFYLPSALMLLPAQVGASLALLPMTRNASASGVLKKTSENEDYALSLDVDLHAEMAAVLVPLLVRTIGNYIEADVTVGDAGHIIVSGITLDETVIANIIK